MRWKHLLMAALVGFAIPACGDSAEEEPIIIVSNNQNQTNNGTNNGTTNNVVPDGAVIEALLATSVTTTQDGLSADVTFDVPENTQSVVITVVGTNPNLYTLDLWDNGDGSNLVTEGSTNSDPGRLYQLCLSCKQRITIGTGAFAAIVPGNDKVAVQPGTHTIRIKSWSGFTNAPVVGDVDLFVLGKVAETRPTTGTLNVNLHFTGSNGWTAATAPTNAAFQKMLEDVDSVWAQAGLRLGEIKYYDIDAKYEVIEDAAQPNSTELPEMFALSRNADDQAVNVFFVDTLLLGGGLDGQGVLLGISGGIPGPAGTMGTARSGVALISKSNPFLPTPLYKVFAHEVGHFLGLYHTSEQDRGFGTQVHDELGDTPENDMRLLMHNTGTGDVISQTQGTVLRLNPWIANGGE